LHATKLPSLRKHCGLEAAGGRTLLSAVLEDTHAYAKPSCAAGATGLSVTACMRGQQAGGAGSRGAAEPRAYAPRAT